MVDSISTSRQAFTGTAAERAALETTNLQALDTFTESDTSNVYFWDGNSWVQTITGGAANIRPIPGTGETTKNRYNVPDATYAEATNSVTWTEIENVTEVYLTLFPDADLGGSPLEHGWVVFDAIDSASGVLLLADAGGAAADVQKFPLPYNVRTRFTGTSYFTRLDIDLTANGILFVEAQ